MTSTDGAEVIQGRLGWEPGDVSKASPDELKPHPKNKEIYGDTESADDLDETFRQSVREKGVLEPLVITENKKIVSGHRRWVAAKDAGLDSVPIRYTEFDDKLAEREALIEFNRQREKTPGQLVNEFEEAYKIEQERAKKRMSEGGSKSPDEASVGNISNPSENDDTVAARDKAAEKVNANASGRTLEKGLEVKQKAEEGNETAQEEWEKLQEDETSFHRAKKNIEKAEAEKKVEKQSNVNETGEAAIMKGRAINWLRSQDDEADLLLTDPPYQTDVDDIYSFAREWLPTAIDQVDKDGFAYVFVGGYTEELDAYLSVLQDLDVDAQPLLWEYKNTIGQFPSDRYKRNYQVVLFCRMPEAPDLNTPKHSEQWAVHSVSAPDARNGERCHRWQKPLELAERFIRHSTEPGDKVIDPFAGSGTHLLAAAELGRDAVGCDTDADAIETAIERGVSEMHQAVKYHTETQRP